MFLNALMLLGLAAAVVPLVLHLLSRARYRTVDWGAMMFLRGADARQRQSTRFNQFLLVARADGGRRAAGGGAGPAGRARGVVRAGAGAAADGGDRARLLGEHGVRRERPQPLRAGPRRGAAGARRAAAGRPRDPRARRRRRRPPSRTCAPRPSCAPSTPASPRSSPGTAGPTWSRRCGSRGTASPSTSRSTGRSSSSPTARRRRGRAAPDGAAERRRGCNQPRGRRRCRRRCSSSPSAARRPTTSSSSRSSCSTRPPSAGQPIEVEVRLRNFGPVQRASLPLVLRSGDRKVYEAKVNLAPDSSASFRASVKEGFPSAGSQVDLRRRHVDRLHRRRPARQRRRGDRAGPRAGPQRRRARRRGGGLRGESDFVRVALAPYQTATRPGRPRPVHGRGQAGRAVARRRPRRATTS